MIHQPKSVRNLLPISIVGFHLNPFFFKHLLGLFLGIGLVEEFEIGKEKVWDFPLQILGVKLLASFFPCHKPNQKS